jgi:Na+/serine symporter
MSRRLAFIVLNVVAYAFVPIGLLGLLGKPLADAFGASLVAGFSAMAVLMGWMLVECISDKSLTASERLRWELLLVVGGPVTACFFLKDRTFSPIGAAPTNQESKVD